MRLGSRRFVFAGSTSLVLHGGLALLALILIGLRTTQPQALAPALIELVALPPTPPLAVPGPSAPGTISGAGNSPKSGTLGRRGHDTPKRSMTRAPAVSDPFADTVIGYDAPDQAEPGTEQGTVGQGLGIALQGSGIGDANGFGYLGDGPGVLRVPSLARRARPKHDYRDLKLVAITRFVGQVIVASLTLDARGKVRGVRIVHGVDRDLDQRATNYARKFEFFPALDDLGAPTSSVYPWAFVIVPSTDDADEDRDGYGADVPGSIDLRRIHR
jgi:hypothetical protein